MVGGFIGEVCTKMLNGIVRPLARLNPNPNVLSLIGLGINVWAATYYALGRFWQAGVVMILANLFDMLDGRVARLNGRTTKFGAFLDSSLDRISDMGVFIGLMVYYIRHAPPSLHIYYLLLISSALVASVMISYTSARAESLIPKCDVGFFRRPERVVLLILGSLLGRMEACIWLMTILSFWTFAHRLYYTWVETRGMDAPPPVVTPNSIPPMDSNDNKAHAEKPEGRRLTLGHKPV